MRTSDPNLAAERRRRILHAATKCFARHGFRGATIAQICTEAGMGPGNVYHYFENKEAIIEAIIKEDLRRNLSLLNELGCDPGGLVLALERTVAEQVRDDFPGLGREIRAEVLAESARNPHVAAIAHGHDQALMGGLTDRLSDAMRLGVVNPDLDAAVTAHLLLALGRGLSLSDRHSIETQQVIEGVRYLLRQFLAPHVKAVRER